MLNLEEKGLLEGLEGVIIQEMVKGNREMVCGIATDPQYGPMMMFGLGGVFIEVMKDVTFRIAPLTDVDAKEMIKSVKAYKLLRRCKRYKTCTDGTNSRNFIEIISISKRLQIH